MDIIIYTIPDKLAHKKGILKNDSDRGYAGEYYWKLPRKPKQFGNWWDDENAKRQDRIYFATKGFIRGYFVLDSFDSDGLDGSPYEFTWKANSWKDIKPIPQKAFQGFKYFKEVKK